MTTRVDVEFNTQGIFPSSGSVTPVILLDEDLAAIGIDNCGLAVECVCIATENLTNKVVVVRSTMVFGQVAGVLSFYGAIANSVQGDASLTTASCNIGVFSNRLLVQGIGVTGKNLRWVAYLKVRTSEM